MPKSIVGIVFERNTSRGVPLGVLLTKTLSRKGDEKCTVNVNSLQFSIKKDGLHNVRYLLWWHTP